VQQRTSLVERRAMLIGVVFAELEILQPKLFAESLLQKLGCR